MYPIVHMHRHTHAVETSFYSIVFFHYSKQVSVTYLKKTLPENIIQEKKSGKKNNFYSFIVFIALTS